jgi:hypothetical protein
MDVEGMIGMKNRQHGTGTRGKEEDHIGSQGPQWPAGLHKKIKVKKKKKKRF